MAGAKVTSVDAIKHFRATLIKFAEAVNASLGNADSDVNRGQSWLEMEARPYWQSEIRKRQVALAHAQEALRMKVLYKNYDGTTPSAVDEKKAVHVAKIRLEIANQKLMAVNKYMNIMTRESVLYKGSVQRFASTVQTTPVAVAQLARIMMAIDAYLAANPEAGAVVGAAGSESKPNYLQFLTPITRAEDASPDAEPKNEAETKSEAPPEPEAQNPEPQPQEQP